MSTLASITELRSMTLADLRTEIRAHQTEVQKMRLQITMGTEKNTGRYRIEKRQISRMMTVLTEKEKEQKGKEGAQGKKGAKDVLNPKPKAAKVSALKKSKKASKVS